MTIPHDAMQLQEEEEEEEEEEDLNENKKYNMIWRKKNTRIEAKE